ncbi:MAG TPA: hypothetical protein VE999_22140 [Gemmataceae bacterium]|nr:hypothetical protein [Gemmataceae bacterium]
MNTVFSVILVAGVIVLIYELLMRSGRGTGSETLRAEVHQRWKNEVHRLIEESPLPSGDENSRLTQQPGPHPEPNESVTRSPTNPADRSHCPACGASITANDERCPSCEIAFVADGSQKWTLPAVGPADGIFLPPTEVRK